MTNFEEKIASLKNTAAEPISGHRKRFEQKMLKQKSKNKNIKWQIITAYAAAILVLLIFSLSYLQKSELQNVDVILSIENDEFLESEEFYQHEIATKLAIIKELKHDSHIQLDDISEFDQSLESLKDDLQEAPGDQRVIEAVLNTYMLKVEALDNIVAILKKVS